MKLFRKYRTLWMMGIIVVLAILFITNFSSVVDGVHILFGAITSLLGGAALAFVLNLIMDPLERRMLKSDNKFVKGHARSLAIFASFLVMFLLIILILSIIIPNLMSAVKMLTSEAPQYFTEVEDLLHKLLKNYPSILEKVNGMKIDWDQTFQTILNFLTKGTSSTNVMDNTMNLVSSFVGFFVNMFIVIVFASYVLGEKERFVQGYYTYLNLFVPQKKRSNLTRDLRIINSSFKSFILGEIIEACILSSMCIVGMLILQLPYATMIGILVGVINMIPMVGAFIGGGIGAFIIFTISPTKCLIFLIFLCIIQQIESNIFFPRVIGNKVGLPGIYVMMTIVVGGTLFGVAGMILGVPLMASIYKIAKIDLAELKRKREEEIAQQNKEAREKKQKKNVVQKMRSEVEQLRASVSGYDTPEQELDSLILEDDRLRQKIDDLLLDEDQPIRRTAPAYASATAGAISPEDEQLYEEFIAFLHQRNASMKANAKQEAKAGSSENADDQSAKADIPAEPEEPVEEAIPDADAKK